MSLEMLLQCKGDSSEDCEVVKSHGNLCFSVAGRHPAERAPTAVSTPQEGRRGCHNPFNYKSQSTSIKVSCSTSGKVSNVLSKGGYADSRVDLEKDLTSEVTCGLGDRSLFYIIPFTLLFIFILILFIF